MKIKSTHIRDFKRFTDLKISEVPAEARMVILVGPNGSGKSSLFEAFNYWFSQARGITFVPDYHVKVGTGPIQNWFELMQRIDVQFHGIAHDLRSDPELRKKAFYFRSAYRHEADFSVNHLTKAADILEDQTRPVMTINPEARVSDNY